MCFLNALVAVIIEVFILVYKCGWGYLCWFSDKSISVVEREVLGCSLHSSSSNMKVFSVVNVRVLWRTLCTVQAHKPQQTSSLWCSICAHCCIYGSSLGKGYIWVCPQTFGYMVYITFVNSVLNTSCTGTLACEPFVATLRQQQGPFFGLRSSVSCCV